MRVLRKAFYRQPGNELVRLWLVEDNGRYDVDMVSQYKGFAGDGQHDLFNESYGEYEQANLTFNLLQTTLNVFNMLVSSEVDQETGEELCAE